MHSAKKARSPGEFSGALSVAATLLQLGPVEAEPTFGIVVVLSDQREVPDRRRTHGHRQMDRERNPSCRDARCEHSGSHGHHTGERRDRRGPKRRQQRTSHWLRCWLALADCRIAAAVACCGLANDIPSRTSNSLAAEKNMKPPRSLTTRPAAPMESFYDVVLRHPLHVRRPGNKSAVIVYLMAFRDRATTYRLSQEG